MTSSEPGRNDPCPCGSGKKYKKCCLPRVKGFTVPARPLDGEPRNTHFEAGADGQMVEVPGSLWLQVHVEDADPPDRAIRDFFTPYSSTLQQDSVLVERVRDCQHKCRAAEYHRRAIDEEIEREIDRYAREHRAQSGAAFVRRNDVLLYETEAFLFQAKSAVDALIRLLAPVVPSLERFDMFRGKGAIAGGVVLEALLHEEDSLFELFESARVEWIQGLKELRDTVTHVAALEGFTFFVETQYHGGPQARIDLPKMPSGQRLDVYCADVVEHLMELTRATLDEVVLRVGSPSPQRGA